MRSAVVVAWLATGCTTSGALDLQLSLPTNPDLRPTGMTTISVLASSAGMEPIENTAVLSGNSFSAGDLPVGTGIQIDVLMNDVSSRLVGVGEAAQLVNIVGDKTTSLAMPVRRPFVYASDGMTLNSFDPTLDPGDAKFQGQLTGVTSPQLAISVGGDRLVVASMTTLQLVDTATNMVTGQPIALPGMIHDAAPIPGTRRVAVAHSAGISIVDIDAGTVTNAATSSVDRITVGPTSDGHMMAYGLVGRAAPAAGPEDACMGASSLVTVDVDAPAAVQPVALGDAVSDIAASPDTPALFATLPCSGKVSSISGAKLTDVSMLERAAVLAVAGERVWAAGTHASTPVCQNSSGTAAMCQIGATATCPQTNSPVSIDYVAPGANLIIQSIPVAGGAPLELDVPERRETMVSTDDPGLQHAQVLHSFGVTPLDIVALPGGQYVSLVASNSYFIGELTDQLDDIVLPCLLATTGDWLLMDIASSSTAGRVRTQCTLTTGPHDTSTTFRNWACDDPPAGEKSMFGEYQPTSVGALFGAR